MNKEFDKWYNSKEFLDDWNYPLLEEAWNGARDKIIEILKNNYRYGCIDKYGNPTDCLKSSVIEEIEQL